MQFELRPYRRPVRQFFHLLYRHLASRASRHMLAQCLAFLLAFQSVTLPLAAADTPDTTRVASKPAPRPNDKTKPAPSSVPPPAPSFVQEPRLAASIVLSPIGTTFNGLAGIEYHQGNHKLLVTANAPAGQPRNFELIASDGAHTAFSNVAGLTGELKPAVARDDVQGKSLAGFDQGEVFVGTAAPGVIARISANGATIQNPWVTLPNESGTVSSLHIDRTNLFAGHVIAITSSGKIWRINARAQATLVANLNLPLSGVTTVPSDASKYGPWSGRILAGAPAQGTLYAVDAAGASTAHALGINPAELKLIPPNENFYGVDAATQKIWGAPDDAFTALIGDLLIAQAAPGRLLRARWNGTSFETEQIAQVGGWKQITFAPAGATPLADAGRFYQNLALIRRGLYFDSGRIEGAVWQTLPEAVTLTGNATLTSDLLVPGTPTFSRSNSSQFAGIIDGPGNPQPINYAVTLTGSPAMRHLVRRVDPVALPTVNAPPLPTGTRDLQLNNSNQNPGEWATVRDLTLTGKIPDLSIPPGTYGNFNLGGNNVVVLGVAGATAPLNYNLQSLQVSGSCEIQTLSPVVLTVKNAVNFSGGAAGNAIQPSQLRLSISNGGLTLAGNSKLYALVRAPLGTVAITGNARLRGTVIGDVLDVNGSGLLQLTDNDVPAPPVNRPPAVNAGADQTLIFPNTASLQGTVTDDGLPTSAAVTQTWSVVSGPGAVTFSNANAPATTATFGQPGAYELRLTATDTLLVSSDTVVITVDQQNQPPTANAGSDQTISLPVNTVTLAGTASDDGLPQGSTLTYLWSKVSGPGTVSFGNASSAGTTASFSLNGLYTLRLTVSDSALSATDDIAILVNRPPAVSAGPDQTINYPVTSVNLVGTVSDDGLPPGSTLSQTWSKVSGPGNVTFSAPNATATTATFATPGTYVLRLTADDTLVSASDEVTVSVMQQNQAPVVNAGADQTVSLPINSVSLTGTATDDGLPQGAALTYTWSRASGPGTVTFSQANSPTTTATFSTSGSYTLRLSVSDTQMTGVDEVNITINAPPTVNAGADRLISMPANSISLTGTTTDDGLPTGSGISVSWSKVNGPGTVTFSNATALTTTATFSAGGVYTLRMTATDGLATSSSDVVISINTAPTVNAGAAQLISAPLNTVNLTGAVSDTDGLPQGGGISVSWNKVVGPGTVTFGNANSATTSASFSATGSYTLRLTANDGAGTSSSEVIITLNAPPAVNAGPDVTLVLPVNTLTLQGAATDDGLPSGPLNYVWTKVSGPGAVTFGTASSPTSTANFASAGAYVLRLTVSDGAASGSDDVTITVNAGNLPPVVNAGADQNIASPNNSTSLFGTVTDDGLPAGAALAIVWTRVSGPAAVSFGNPQAAVTTVTFNEQGTYVLRLTASDAQYTVSDDVQVVVGCASNLSKLDIMLVIDRSGSMQGQALLDAKIAARGFVDRLQLLTNDQVGLVTFGDAATLDQSLTHDAAAIKSKIDAIQLLPGFGTDIGSGISRGQLELTGVRRNPNALPLLILLSDGDETLLGANFAADNTKAAGTRLLTIGTGALSDINFNGLRRWASSPTDFYYAPTSADLGLIYGYIAGNLCRNLPPLANAGPDFNVFQPATAMLNGSVSDDGLPVGRGLEASWTQVSGPAPAAFLSLNAPVTPVVFPQPGSYVLRLTATDSVFTISDEVSITVLPEASLQGASLNLTTANAAANQIGTTVTATATLRNASNQPIPNFAMRLNVAGANLNTATGTTDANGAFSLTYTGSNSGVDTLTATALGTGQTLDSNDLLLSWTTSPTTPLASVTQGWIGAPLHQSTLTGLVPVTLGQGVTLTQGKVELCKDAPLAVGCSMLNNNAAGSAGAVLATLDTTQLANGPYIIRLTGTNANNQQLVSQVLVTVAGENKPGRMTLKITEFTIPVTGIPLTIGRRYDSLERNISGDFGYGWALDVYATRLEVAPDYDVTLTDPGTGRRVTFSFAPLSYGGIVSYLFAENYVAEPGFYGKLTSNGCGLFYQSGQQFRCLFAAAYQPTTYTYTDPYGRQYEMGMDGKLRSIRDLHGNTLTVTATGIVSSTGRSVPFIRDAQGRITQITDTGGKVYQYSYHPTGELKEVTLPGVVTRPSYIYDTGHHLLTARDARGNAEATVTYQPDGRIATMTDAVGNLTQYSYNLTGGVLPLTGQPEALIAQDAKVTASASHAAMQSATSYATSTTVIYADGGTNTLFYDSHGLLVAQTDASGKTATNTYDANHNLLTETNVLGQITRYSYDAQGNATSITDAGSNTIRGTYNEFSLPVTDTDALGNTRTILYDENGLPTEIRDSLGTLAKFVFDTHGSLLSFTDGASGTKTYSYDQYGNLIAETDPLGNTTKYTYDQMGRLLSAFNPRGFTTTYSYDDLGRQTQEYHYYFADFLKRYEYDANGNRTAFIDELGRRTSYTYDAANRLTKITFADNTFAEFTYNQRDQRLTAKDQGGSTTSHEYDLEGRVTKITRPDGKFATAGYDASGRVTSVTDERGNTTRFNYDPSCDCRDRLTSVTNALNQLTQYRYDAAGRRVAFVDALNRETKYSYDVRGRLTQITFPDNTSRQLGYDGASRRTSETDEAGKVTRYNYNLTGDLIAVIDALNQTTSYGYDANRNLTAITDANNRTTTFNYTSRDQLQNRTLPNNSVEHYQYDAGGNLKTRQDFRGKTTTYNYDLLNRLTSIVPDVSLAEPTISYTYTANGDRATMTDSTGTTIYTYDGQHCLMGKQTPFGTLSYDYDATFNLKQIKSSNANGVWVDYTYDALNRLETVNDRRLTSGLTTYSYDAVGNLRNTTLPNGVQTEYSYNSVNLATNVRIGKGAQGLANYAYTFQPTGHRATVTEQSGRTVSYGYDDVWRLTNETISGAGAAQSGVISYMLDKVGNRLQRNSTVPGIPSTVNTYNSVDRMSGDGYDTNGNTTQADGKTYTYDFEDRLKSVNGGQITLQYDGDGNRVSKTAGGITTQYLVVEANPTNVAQVVEEIVSGQTQQVYTYGNQLLSQQQLSGGLWKSSFYGNDSPGSARLLSDASGAVADTFDYDAFGNLLARTGTTPNNYQYRSEQLDPDLAFYHLRARFYDHQRGRFRTMDAYLGRPDQPTSLHKYLYAAHDPVNLIDPTGNASVSEYAVGVRTFVARQAVAIRSLAKQIACTVFTVASEIGNDPRVAVSAGFAELAFCKCKKLPGGKHRVVIGETVKRVENAAKDVGGRTFLTGKDGVFKDFEGVVMRGNRRWIRHAIDGFYEIVDIGIDKERTRPRSEFYKMEQATIEKNKYRVIRCRPSEK